MKTKDFKIIYIFHTFKVYFSLLIILTLITLITIPVVILTLFFDKDKVIYLTLTRFFVKMFFTLNFINYKKRINLKGLKSPKAGEKRIYVINHSSLLDGLLMFMLPGRIKFMAKDTYTKIPVFGLGISLADNVSVGKGGEGEQLDIFMKSEEIINKGYPLVIFPEGTRTRNGKIGRFQNSAFMLSLSTGADIVPVVFDTYNCLRPESFLVRSNDFNVEVLPVIKYETIKGMSYKEVSNKVKREIINKLLEIYDNKRKIRDYYRNSAPFLEIDKEMKEEIIT